MKSPTAYYLLLLYVVLVLKPAVPVISNLVMHTFSGISHVATVHAKYGSNHVQKEVAENSAGDTNKDQQVETKGQFEAVAHLFSEKNPIQLFFPISTADYNRTQLRVLIPVYPNIISPPPQRS